MVTSSGWAELPTTETENQRSRRSEHVPLLAAGEHAKVFSEARREYTRFSDMVRMLAGFVMLVLAWLALACTPALAGPSPRVVADAGQKGPAPVRILDSGFAPGRRIPGVTSPDAPQRVVIALRIENPKPDFVAEGLRLDLRLVDRARMPLADAVVDVAQLLPGERRNVVVVVAYGVERPEVWALEAVVAGPACWRPADAVLLPAVELQPPPALAEVQPVPGLGLVHGDRLIQGQFIGVTSAVADAVVTNRLDAFFPAMDLAAVAFDREGRIIGGGQRTQAFAPLQSARATVRMTVATDLKEIARVELTAAYPEIALSPAAPCLPAGNESSP